MIKLSEVVLIHDILIKRFGGTVGIRDHNALESAINRPFATFDGKDLHPEIIDKATAILESLVSNHPFIDGNKRIGYVMMRLWLLQNDLDIVATQNEKYELVISVAKGEFRFDEIKGWLQGKIRD